MSASGTGFGVYRDRRMLVILVLGLSSGLPLLLVGSTLSARLAEADVSLTGIGLFGWAATAYTIKFLWAPLVDSLRVPCLTRRLGRRRAWLVASQVALLGSIVALASCDPRDSLVLVAAAAVAVAFASATQDIVVDAYRIDVLGEPEQGAGGAAAVLGYRVGMLVGGAGALLIADAASWVVAYASMAAVVGAVALFVVLVAPEPAGPAGASALVRPGATARRRLVLLGVMTSIVDPFRRFAQRRRWVLLLGIVVTYKLGDALLGAMAMPFYLDGLGFSKSEVAAIGKVWGLAMTLAGVVAGGALVARLGVLRGVLVCGLAQAASNLVFTWMAGQGHDPFALTLAISVENLTGGLGTAAFVALLSNLCDASHSATQYALLTSLAALARNVLAPLGGWLADSLHGDWSSYFAWTAAFGLPALVLLGLSTLPRFAPRLGRGGPPPPAGLDPTRTAR